MSSKSSKLKSKVLLESEFEQALIDVANATDGNGDVVRLLSITGRPTAQQLKEETFRFMEGFDIESMYIKPDANGVLVGSAEVEITVWENLALLARATAAAIRLEATRC